MGIQQHYRNLGESNNKSQRNIKKAAGDQRMCHLDGGKSATGRCRHQNCWDLWIFIALTMVTLRLCQKIAIEAMAQSK
jgi:hypothetical protein